jgi:putative sensory transduction regulator
VWRYDVRRLTGKPLQCEPMTRKPSTTLKLIVAAITFLQLSAQPAIAQDKQSAKIAQLLEGSGYSYTKAADSVWTIPFQGNALPKFNVVASTQNDVLVLFVIVAEQKNLRVTPELMQRMLKLNGDLDRVKIGIDKDGDAFVRIDLSVRILDSQELKGNIKQVAAATDEVFTAIKPFITAPK